MSSSFLSSHPDFTFPPPLGPLLLHPSLNGSFANNPLEQFHFRTVQRIIKEHPEYTETYQLPGPSLEPAPALKRNAKLTASDALAKMSGRQTMNWTGDADAKLLLAILKVSDVKPDFEAVAKQLTTDTTTCTPRAVQEHLKRLRKIAQAETGDLTTPSNSKKATATINSNTTTTPTKATASRKGAGTGAGVKKSRKPAAAAAAGGRGRKKGKAVPVVDDAGDDETLKEEDGHYEREESASGSEYLGLA